MKIKGTLKLVFLALGLVSSSAMGDDWAGLDDQVRENPDLGELPPEVTLRGFAFAGSGCPADSARGEMPLGQELLVFLDSFTAEVGAGVPVRDRRKNCQMNLHIEHTEGWQYSVESIEYAGRVEVDSGITARVQTSYYFQGDEATHRSYTLFEGPMRRGFRITDGVDDEDAIWSPCDAQRSLNVNLEARLSDDAGSGGDGRVTFRADRGVILRLKWRRCE